MTQDITTEDTQRVTDLPDPTIASEPITDQLILTQSEDLASQINADSEDSSGRSFTILGQDIDLVSVSDGLVCPKSWLEEAAAHPQLENVQMFISRLSPCGKATPWLISSMSKDLSGADRTDSPSHMAGDAMDIAPMFSDTEVLPSDPPISGLAWNIKSLIVLSQGQLGDMPVFVEGDHLHFSKEILPAETGELPVMWSTSTTYESAREEELDPILTSLRNSYWIWRTSTLTLSPPTKQTFARISSMITHRE